MYARTSRFVMRQKMALLCCLALWLPLAQLSALSHLLTHANPAQSVLTHALHGTLQALPDAPDSQQPPEHSNSGASCAVCWTAAVASGTALGGAAPSVFGPQLAPAVWLASSVSLWWAPLTLAYWGRAPPLVQI
jgi:hypothetical protein